MKSSIQSTAGLAQELGLSRWSVSRALNFQPGLNKSTAEKIRETARRHGFTPSLLGRGLRSGKTDLIGICAPNLVDYFLTDKISRLREAMSKRGLRCVLQIISTLPSEENAALVHFAAMRCAGVVSLASSLHAGDAGIQSLHSAGIPLVRLDPLLDEPHGEVMTDRAFAMRQAVEHLHHLGHRKLAVMGINPNHAYGRQRIRGLQQGCRKQGWDFSRDVILLNRDDSGAASDFELGAILSHDYISLGKKRPTAILALNDRVALGAMHQLQKQGIHVPRDVSILGYDNADFCPHVTPSLTSLDLQAPVLIDNAVKMLLPASSNKTRIESAGVRIKPRLIVRESTGPAPRNG